MLQGKIEHEALTYSRNPGEVDPEALIAAHGSLVRRIAWHVHSRMSSAIELEDLIQIGLVALVSASRSFQDRGIGFVSYATTRIRGSMIDELRRTARLARAGMAQRRKLAATREQLEQTLRRHATDAEMAEALGLEATAYHAMVASSRAAELESIDEAYSDTEAWFADLRENAQEGLEQAELQAALARAIEGLSEREAMVLQLYFSEELNLDEIGEILDVGAARICQIKKAALIKLRERLEGWR
jgi:RNA polymerase sigma factor for flagellar operon FliA